jgi:CO/xanthine dehydrogenase FAD-binding subunit
MKPVPFDYVRPNSVAEACAILSGDDGAQIIAGGQTLVPLLAMRLARPTRLVDIQRIPELSGIRSDAADIVIGATTRQVAVERSALVADRLPLLAKALPWIGHGPTRNRGTVGGSVANADNSAEIPLVLVTLRGKVVLNDGKVAHTVDGDDFFLGPMMTILAQGMCLTEVRLPIWTGESVGAGFHEISARRSDFAFVAAAAQVKLDPSGRCSDCVIGIGGATPVPTRLDAACEALKGSLLSELDIADAIKGAGDQLEIMRDSHATPEYRRRVAEVLAIRAVCAAKQDALAARAGGYES